MERILKNPGLQHLAENLFWNLNYEELENCRLINESSRHILDNPMFWIKKFIRRGLSKKNQADWTQAIQVTKDTDLAPKILLYLKKSSKNHLVVDLPCFITSDTLQKYIPKIENFLVDIKRGRGAATIKLNDILQNIEEYAAFFQIFTILTINSNTTQVANLQTGGNENQTEIQDDTIHPSTVQNKTEFIDLLTSNILKKDYCTCISWTLFYFWYHKNDESVITEIIKILAPLAENLNRQYRDEISFQGRPFKGCTLIHVAIKAEYIAAVKILVNLTLDPNVPDNYGRTPIHHAVISGNTEIVRFLAPLLVGDPNIPNKGGWTPIHSAAIHNHLEIIKILAPLTLNPNAPDNDGDTPIDLHLLFHDQGQENTEMIRFLKSFEKSV